MFPRYSKNGIVPALYILLAGSVFAGSCWCQSFQQKHTVNSGEYEIDYFQRKIVVTALGASGARQKSIAEKRLWALTEARKNCITLAATAVGDVAVEGTTVMQSAVLKEHNISLRIDNYVRGIKDLRETCETQKDGSVLATVTMIIAFDGDGGLGSLLHDMLFDNEQQQFHAPYRETGSPDSRRNITGIVLDTRTSAVPFQPSLTSRIYDVTGRLIYSPGFVSRKYAFRIGVAGYSKDLKNVAGRIGENPLTIGIVGIIENDPSSVLISREDADRLLALEKERGILSACRVAFRVR